MDISKFITSKSQSSVSSHHGYLYKKWNQIKLWLLPSTSERRSQRIGQIKSLGIFISAITVIALYEDKIREILEIEANDLQKLTM